MSTSLALVESVNVGVPRQVMHDGRRERTAIWKSPVLGRVAVRGVNLAGDDQADRSVHGGPEKAVYAYSREDLDWWADNLGHPLDAGTFGENLTTRGLDVSGALVGERWRIGTVVLEVVQPRFPCFKLGIRMGDSYFLKRFTRANRPGAYLRIVREGELSAGDSIDIVHRPTHTVSVALMARARESDRSLAAQLLDAPELSDGWQEWARHQAEKQRAAH